jgi:hypothetical protein
MLINYALVMVATNSRKRFALLSSLKFDVVLSGFDTM